MTFAAMEKSKRGSTQSVGDAFRELIRAYNLTARFDEASLANSWERLVGKPIARRTKRLTVRDKVLFIEFDSPAIRQDILLHKTRVLEILSREYGTGIITDIVPM